ncbi:MAG: MoxR family ATPase [Endomicrobia bacterium]|nr:MoxR family ATPase [Endomicrobiia bacterium]
MNKTPITKYLNKNDNPNQNIVKQSELKRISYPTQKIEVLPQLKIYGYSKVEDAILAGLVTGDPVLLIGKHGSGKTMLVSAIASSLGLRFIAYDASKALFDDIVGYPNPKSLQEGIVDYVPTPLSIWDKEFILIDEISRAMPSMQNKWLEIIRSRTVMGRPITSLKYIFAAMNPLGEYIGVAPLDIALLGRFAFIIRVPEIYEIDTEDIKKVITNISKDDAVMIETIHKNNNVVSTTLPKLIDTAKKLYSQISQKYEKIIVPYLFNFLKEFLQTEHSLDGRRLGMLNRNIIAYLSIATVKYGKKYVERNLTSLIYNCVEHSLPFAATDEAKNIYALLPTLHQKVLISIKSQTELSSKLFQQHYELKKRNIQWMVEMLISTYDNLDEIEKYEIISNLTLPKEDITPEQLLDYVVGVRKLLKFLLAKTDVEHEIITKVVQIYRNITSITNIARDINLYSSPLCAEDGKPIIESITLNDLATDIAYRCILNLPHEKSWFGMSTSNINYAFFMKLRILIKKNYIDKSQKEKQNL